MKPKYTVKQGRKIALDTMITVYTRLHVTNCLDSYYDQDLF